jgi:hypothetical protein
VNNYSIDLAILKNDEPYFIEINSFGKEYPAGSSLFHWLNDEDILYDRKCENKIYFRYAVNYNNKNNKKNNVINKLLYNDDNEYEKYENQLMTLEDLLSKKLHEKIAYDKYINNIKLLDKEIDVLKNNFKPMIINTYDFL